MFKNKQGKVRAGFNILATLAAFLAATFIINMLISTVATAILMATGDLEIVGIQPILTDRGNFINNILILASMIVQEIACILVVLIAWNKIMKKKLIKLGLTSLRDNSKDLVAGLILGIVSMLIVFALIMLTGNAVISDWTPSFSGGMIYYLVVFILVGFAEEMLGRGYIMGVLRHNGNNKYVIFIVSMIIFALMHGLNPGMNAVSYLNLFLIGGAFSYMYYKSGNLWMCIGYHITWNYLQGLLGFPVSGTASAPMFQMVYEKNTIWNGGVFGPEAGLLVTLVSILIVVFTYFYYRNKNYDFMTEDVAAVEAEAVAVSETEAVEVSEDHE